MHLTYKTVAESISHEIPKIKGSKFIGHILPIISKDDAEKKIKIIQNEHHQANHNCFAYRAGIRYHQDLFGNWLVDPERIHASDDGEPGGTAAYPMKNVLMGEKLENVLLVVTRSFGGIKLGIGGLVQAYTEASKAVITKANIITQDVLEQIKLEMEQAKVPKFLAYCSRENIKIISQDYKDKATFTLGVNVTKIEEFKKAYL